MEILKKKKKIKRSKLRFIFIRVINNIIRLKENFMKRKIEYNNYKKYRTTLTLIKEGKIGLKQESLKRSASVIEDHSGLFMPKDNFF